MLDTIHKDRDRIIDLFESTRRNLLLSCLIGILVGVTGIIPEKIEAIGISLTTIPRIFFVITILFTVLYFQISYCMYLLRREVEMKRASSAESNISKIIGYNYHSFLQIRSTYPVLLKAYKISKYYDYFLYLPISAGIVALVILFVRLILLL